MTHPHAPRLEEPDRWMDLLADVATGDADFDQNRSDMPSDVAAQADELEHAAAALLIALTDDSLVMPASLRSRIVRTVERPEPIPIAGAQRVLQPPPRAPAVRLPTWRGAAIAGWAAAAALALLAAVAWLGDPAAPTRPVSIALERQELIRAGAAQLAFQSWDDGQVAPEVRGVTGDVVWDDRSQRGYVRLTGLPPNNPDRQQYQLWIIDARFGDQAMSQRISGGVFDMPMGAKEVLVPIDARMAVGEAVAFAVTIEPPGGVWVSDMSRRVVIASRG